MQNSTGTNVLPWILTGVSAIATLFGIPLTHFLTKKQYQANTHKTESEGREIDSRIINDAHETLAEQSEVILNLRIQRAWDKTEISNLKWDIQTKNTEIAVLNEQVRSSLAELMTYRKESLVDRK
jgi:hypothetical protein